MHPFDLGSLSNLSLVDQHVSKSHEDPPWRTPYEAARHPVPTEHARAPDLARIGDILGHPVALAEQDDVRYVASMYATAKFAQVL